VNFEKNIFKQKILESFVCSKIQSPSIISFFAKLTFKKVKMTTSSSFQIFVVCFLFQMVLSAPILSNVPSENNKIHGKKLIQFPTFDYPIQDEMEILKRDFEEPIFIDPQQSDSETEFPIFYLPRTDRKQNNLFPLNYFDANNQMFQMNEENPFENLQIDLRSIPMKHTEEVDERQRQPPSQKEFLGPIVVGPQTKSTQTSSLKKA
jgi:hypothetical protein